MRHITCRNCGEEFPIQKIIDGKRRYLNKRKFCLKCSPFGSKNTRPDLTKKRLTRAEKTRRLRKRNQEFIENTKKRVGSCQYCGWNKHPEILQFHHRNPNKKERGITTFKANTYSIKTIQKEMDKCDVICPNCHMWLHKKEQLNLP